MARGRQAPGAAGEDWPGSLSVRGTVRAEPLLECLRFLNVPDCIPHLWVSSSLTYLLLLTFSANASGPLNG